MFHILFSVKCRHVYSLIPLDLTRKRIKQAHSYIYMDEQLMPLTYSGKSKNVVYHVLNKGKVGVHFQDRKSTSGS